MILIERWLKGNRNFIVGKSLYAKFGNDKAVMQLLEKGETAFSLNALVHALEAIAATHVPGTSKHAEPAVMEMPKADNAVLDSLQEQWKEKYMRMNLLRHSLDKYGTDNSRETMNACDKICKEILSLEKEINGLWNERDYFLVHGRLPDVKEDKAQMPTNAVELASFINSCARQIRRYKHTSVSNSKHAQLMEDYKAKYKAATGKDYGEKN